VVYALGLASELHEVARFSGPRFVAASGNGALVVRGSCAPTAAAAEGTRSYCILGRDGRTREVGVRGEIGAERLVALDDGRTVVLVPPRLGMAGRLNIISGDKVEQHELRIPDEPRRSAKAARRGLWLEGFEQRGKNAVGGWVEAGGPVVGVKVRLDGEVTLGELYDEGGDVLVSGPLALGVNDSGHALESTDGGMRWQELEVPSLPESPGDAKTRGCTPVGCALRTWLRVGWGKPAVAGDLEPAPTPDPVAVEVDAVEPLRLSCRLVTLPASPKAGPRPAPESVGDYSSWRPFRDVPPPPLGKDQIGVDKGTYSNSTVNAHGYVWGPRGADWTRTGSWLVRFDDRFDAAGGVRSSAITRSPWPDAATATEAIGAQGHGGYWRWFAVADAGGTGALVSICGQGGPNVCATYSVSAERPIVPLKITAASRPPANNGAAKIGEAWYFVVDGGAAGLELWRSDAHDSLMLKRYRRVSDTRQAGLPEVSLVRTALGGELGLLVTVPGDEVTGAVGRWVVYPLDGDRGTLDDPVSLGPARVVGPLRRCHPYEDGWLADVRPEPQTVVRLRGAYGYVDQIDFRLRLTSSGACVQSLAGRAGRGFSKQERDAEGFDDRTAGDAVPLAATEQYEGKRWPLECKAIGP
jgi:hypothetical protein